MKLKRMFIRLNGEIKSIEWMNAKDRKESVRKFRMNFKLIYPLQKMIVDGRVINFFDALEYTPIEKAKAALDARNERCRRKKLQRAFRLHCKARTRIWRMK